jgi:hypothetical protein
MHIFCHNAHHDNHHLGGTEDNQLHPLAAEFFKRAELHSDNATACRTLVDDTFKDVLDAVSVFLSSLFVFNHYSEMLLLTCCQ